VAKINSIAKCSVTFSEHFVPSLIVAGASSEEKIKKEQNNFRK